MIQKSLPTLIQKSVNFVKKSSNGNQIVVHFRGSKICWLYSSFTKFTISVYREKFLFIFVLYLLLPFCLQLKLTIFHWCHLKLTLVYFNKHFDSSTKNQSVIIIVIIIIIIIIIIIMIMIIISIMILIIIRRIRIIFF